MDKVSFTVSTRTPIWTGGIDKQMDRLHATGLIGSLRWWYEVIVRGLGGEACDPTSDSRHQYDAKQVASPEDQLCSACYLFGATGWRRLFRLKIIPRELRKDGPVERHETTGSRYRRDSRRDRRNHPQWFFSSPGRSGSFLLEFTRLSPHFDPVLVQGTLRLIAAHGGLAARTQLGYGWVDISFGDQFDANNFVRAVEVRGSPNPELPALTNMFFATLSTSDPGISATLNAKYDVRKAFRDDFKDRELRHYVCGTVERDRQGSKLSFTQSVNGEMRVWGWLPQRLPNGMPSRDVVIKEIYAALGQYGRIKSWREFDSDRDSVRRFNSPEEFFASLV